ncbi:MAG: hypothetical protein JJU13_13655 [Balneolaceae bacterium]|nr:hypothetical protein [Balneolaceae bacterium]
MKKIWLFLIFISGFGCANAQTISGTFPLLAGEKIRLEGFEGFESYLISTTDISQDGTFTLEYSRANYGGNWFQRVAVPLW